MTQIIYKPVDHPPRLIHVDGFSDMCKLVGGDLELMVDTGDGLAVFTKVCADNLPLNMSWMGYRLHGPVLMARMADNELADVIDRDVIHARAMCGSVLDD